MILINVNDAAVLFTAYKFIAPLILMFLASVWDRDSAINCVIKILFWIVTIIGIMQWFIKI